MRALCARVPSGSFQNPLLVQKPKDGPYAYMTLIEPTGAGIGLATLIEPSFGP
jgi:hypothetical protein